MSFPLVHSLNNYEDDGTLCELLRKRRDVGCLSEEQNGMCWSSSIALGAWRIREIH
jgi:hypothetical protein